MAVAIPLALGAKVMAHDSKRPGIYVGIGRTSPAEIAPPRSVPDGIKILYAEKEKPDEHQKAYLDDLEKAFRAEKRILLPDQYFRASEHAKEPGVNRSRHMAEATEEAGEGLIHPIDAIETAARYGRNELVLDMVNWAWNEKDKHPDRVEFNPDEMAVKALTIALHYEQSELVEPLIRSTEMPQNALMFLSEAQSSKNVNTIASLAKEYGAPDQEIKDALTKLYASKLYSFSPDYKEVPDILLDLHKQGIRLPEKCLTEDCEKEFGISIDNEETRHRILRSMAFLDKVAGTRTNAAGAAHGHNLAYIEQCHIPTQAEISAAKETYGSFVINSLDCSTPAVELGGLEKSSEGLKQNPSFEVERPSRQTLAKSTFNPPK